MRNKALKFIFLSASMTVFTATSLANSTLPAKMICEGADTTDVGYGYTGKMLARFKSDTRSDLQKKLSNSEKVKRIATAIRRKHNGTGGYTPEQIAKTVVWAADCTGTNLKFWSAMIKHESSFCAVRLNKTGGDAGCGQFTSVALNELRHQLQVPGAGGSGSNAARDAMRSMVKSCYKTYGGWTDGSVAKGDYNNYMKFMSLPIGSFNKGRREPFQKGTIKEALKNARAMHAGLLSSALLLKFYYGLKGGYTVAGNGWGAIAQYNGGGVADYYSRIKGEFKYLPVSQTCVSDEYTAEIMESACEMEILEDYPTCMKNAEKALSGVDEISI